MAASGDFEMSTRQLHPSSSLSVKHAEPKIVPPSSNPLPSLQDFLGQIKAGASSSSCFPFDVQHALVSTQRSRILSSFRQQVHENDDEMQRVILETESNEKRLLAIESGLQSLKNEERELIPAQLTLALEEYRVATQRARQNEYLINTLDVLRRATNSLETFEAHISSGKLESESHQKAVNALNFGLLPLGLSLSEETKSESKQESHRWLVPSEGPKPRAIERLQRRIQEAQRNASEMLAQAWSNAVRVEVDQHTAAATVTVASSVKTSSSSAHSMSLQAINEALNRTNNLSPRLMWFANRLVVVLSNSLLQCAATNPVNRWQIEVSPINIDSQSPARALTILPAGHSAAASTTGLESLDSLQSILQFISDNFTGHLPSSHLSNQFARVFLAPLVPLILSILRRALPPEELVGSIALNDRIAAVQKVALALHATLRSSGFITEAALSADSSCDEDLSSPSRILTFAREISTQVALRWSISVRDAARKLCTSHDAGELWSAEEIEVEPAVPLPQKEEDKVEQLFLDSGPPGNNSMPRATADADEDGWGWDDEEIGNSFPPQSRGSYRPGDSFTTLKRLTLSASAGPGSPIARDDSPMSNKTNTRSALGGVRVLKPRDQFGSGPLPKEDDEDGWGFDDEVSFQQPDVGQMPPISAASSVAQPAGIFEEENAWFAEDLEKESSAQEGHDESALHDSRYDSSFGAPRSEQVPKSQSETGDTETAWFAEDLSKSTNTFDNLHQAQLRQDLGESSSSSSAQIETSLSNSEDLNIDEDAWGLSEAEKAKRASMMILETTSFPNSAMSDWQAKFKNLDINKEANPAKKKESGSADANYNHSLQAGVSDSMPTTETSAPAFLPIMTPEDDFDNDAWGFSQEEHASKIQIVPSAQSSVPSHSSERSSAVSDDGEGEATGGQQNCNHLSAVLASQAESSRSTFALSPEGSPAEGLTSSDERKQDGQNLITKALYGPHDGSAGPELNEERTRQLDDGNCTENLSVASTNSVNAPETPRLQLDLTLASVTERYGKGSQSLDETASLAGSSDTSTSFRQPFPIESALPQDLGAHEAPSAFSLSRTYSPGRGTISLLASSSLVDDGRVIAGSEISLPSENTIGDSLPLRTALSPNTSTMSSILATRPFEANNSFIKSNADISSAGASSSESLPPTPKAERQLQSGSTSPAVEPSDAEQSEVPSVRLVESSSSDDGPYMPIGGDGEEIPFPIHSAMPWDGREGSFGARTGPPSVVSASAESDIALPPSPPPRGIDTPQSAPHDTTTPKKAQIMTPFTSTSDRQHRSGSGSSAGACGIAESLTAVSTSSQWLSAQQSRPVSGGDVILGRRSETRSNQISLGESTEAPGSTPATSGEEEEEISVAATVGSTQSRGSSDTRERHKIQDNDPWADLEAGTRTSVTAPSMLPCDGGSQNPNPSADRLVQADEDWGWDEEAFPQYAIRSDVSQAAASPDSPASASEIMPNFIATSPTSASTAAIVVSVGNAADFGWTSSAPSSGIRQISAAMEHGAALSSNESPRVVKWTEKCLISQRSRRLVALANRVLKNTVDLARERRKELQSGSLLLPPPERLLKTLPDIFETHRALMPTLHHETLANVPSLAMQFANDCRFLAREIGVMAQRLSSDEMRDLTSESTLAKIKDAMTREARSTTLLGKRIFESQLAAQAQALAERLQQADSLLQVYREERYEACQRCFEQVMGIFEELNRAWGGDGGSSSRCRSAAERGGAGSGVLGRSARMAALGTLLEATLRGLWANVIDMDHIGEREGQRLANLFRILGGGGSSSSSLANERGALDSDRHQQQQGEQSRLSRLEELFVDGEGKGDPQSLITFFVPSWIKVTGYLPEILLGSLADVEFLLFDAGALVPRDVLAASSVDSPALPLHIGSEEAKRLIRATFADTKRRSDLLTRVDRGR